MCMYVYVQRIQKTRNTKDSRNFLVTAVIAGELRLMLRENTCKAHNYWSLSTLIFPMSREEHNDRSATAAVQPRKHRGKLR